MEKYTEKIRIRIAGSNSRIFRAASKPFISGICKSRITKSGFNSLAFVTASVPLEALPQILNRCRDSRIFRSPRLKSSESSAISILAADENINLGYGFMKL